MDYDQRRMVAVIKAGSLARFKMEFIAILSNTTKNCILDVIRGTEYTFGICVHIFLRHISQKSQEILKNLNKALEKHPGRISVLKSCRPSISICQHVLDCTNLVS